jgi:capsule polysaccharide export protein KpsE/RkpR
MSQKENLLGVIQTFFKWKRPILTTIGLAFVGSLVISLFLSNYYKATTTFYAASQDLMKPDVMFGNSTKSMEFYGNGNDIDRILTVASSTELKEYLIKKFYLYAHYDIDSTHQKAPIKVLERFTDLYNVQKTKFDAIEISIEDEDRVLAATITNAAREHVNVMALAPIKSKQQELIDIYQRNIADKEKLLSTTIDSLILLRKKYGVYNVETQSELLSTIASQAEANLIQKRAALSELLKNPAFMPDTIVLLKADVRGLEEKLKSINEPSSKSSFNLERFNAGMSIVEQLTGQQKELRAELLGYKERLSQLRAAQTSGISAIHLVEDAEVPVEKSRPKRAFLVLGVTLLAALFSLLGALIMDTYKDVNWREITHPE